MYVERIQCMQERIDHVRWRESNVGRLSAHLFAQHPDHIAGHHSTSIQPHTTHHVADDTYHTTYTHTTHHITQTPSPVSTHTYTSLHDSNTVHCVVSIVGAIAVFVRTRTVDSMERQSFPSSTTSAGVLSLSTVVLSVHTTQYVDAVSNDVAQSISGILAALLHTYVGHFSSHPYSRDGRWQPLLFLTSSATADLSRWPTPQHVSQPLVSSLPSAVSPPSVPSPVAAVGAPPPIMSTKLPPPDITDPSSSILHTGSIRCSNTWSTPIISAL